MAGATLMTQADDDEINRIMSMPEHELRAELAKEGKTMEGVAAEMRQVTERAIAEVARRRAADPRLYMAIRLWHRFAPEGHTDWEEERHKAEYLAAVDGIETGDLFNLLLRRIDFDGADPKTFSLAELQRAIKGAEWPKPEPKPYRFPDPRGPFFSTKWEREDYERRQRGEPEKGPLGTGTPVGTLPTTEDR